MQYIDFTDVFGKTFRVSKFIHGAPFAPTGRGIDGAFVLMDRYRALGGNTFDVQDFTDIPASATGNPFLPTILRTGTAAMM